MAPLPIEFEHGTGDPAPAPTLGQHTREVLHEHGFNDEEITALVDAARE